jgi:uncharacterized membrane protein YhhN
MWTFAMLLIPAALAVLALRTGRLPLKVGVPGTCALILLLAIPDQASVAPVVAAFVFSMIGDAFLSTKGDSENRFVLGIAGFFVAHLGYLSFALLHGTLSGWILALLLAGYLAYYVLKLKPAIDAPLLSTAALLYLLISCLTLSAAAGLTLPLAVKALYVAGIALIVISDTFISFDEFLDDKTFTPWILPTYYLAQLCVTAALLFNR